MTTAQTGTSTPYRVESYLTIDEFKEAPTGVDLSNLQSGGTQAQQDARLAEVIARASSWVDDICDQVLAATTDTQQGRVRVNRDGMFVVHPRYWPVLQVTDFRYGALPTSMSPMQDLTNVFVEPQMFTVAAPGFLSSSSAGPIQFGPVLGRGGQVFCQWTYVNGYPNTLLSSGCNAGDTTITVNDPTGILADLTYLSIFDGSSISAGPPSSSERGLLVTGVSGSTLTLASPVAYAHAAGVSVSALPDGVKQATILLTKALIMTRGAEAIVAEDFGGSTMKTAAGGGIEADEVAIAVELLERYARVR